MIEAAEIAALFEEFRASERADALASTKRSRLTFTRNVGSQGSVAQASLEAVVDQNDTVDDIYELVARFDQAIDRQKAKIDMAAHYARIAMKLGEVEMARRNIASRRIEFTARNKARSADRRREEVELTTQQEAELNGQQKSVEELVAEIAGLWQAIAEAKAIIAGADPFDYLDRTLRDRQEAAAIRLVRAA